jgi:hypothetical protein
MKTDLAARDIWQSWFRWTAAGEFAGFLAPALVGSRPAGDGHHGGRHGRSADQAHEGEMTWVQLAVM